MPLFSYCINDDPRLPDVDTGFVRAESYEDALARIGDQRANVYLVEGGDEKAELSTPPAA